MASRLLSWAQRPATPCSSRAILRTPLLAEVAAAAQVQRTRAVVAAGEPQPYPVEEAAAAAAQKHLQHLAGVEAAEAAESHQPCQAEGAGAEAEGFHQQQHLAVAEEAAEAAEAAEQDDQRDPPTLQLPRRYHAPAPVPASA